MQKKLTDKQIKLLKDILDRLNKAETLDVNYDPESKKFLSEFGLISNKPYIIVCNVDEQSKNGNNFTKLLKEK